MRQVEGKSLLRPPKSQEKAPKAAKSQADDVFNCNNYSQTWDKDLRLGHLQGAVGYILKMTVKFE